MNVSVHIASITGSTLTNTIFTDQIISIPFTNFATISLYHFTFPND